MMDRLANARICPAAADVAGHGVVNLGVSGLGGLGEQRSRRHDLSRLAIAALRDVDFDPGALDGMTAGGGEAFNRCDVFSGHGRNRRDAAADRGALDVHGTGAAERHAASEFSAGHVEGVAENPEQRHVGIDVDRCGFSVEDEMSRHEETSSESSSQPHVWAADREQIAALIRVFSLRSRYAFELGESRSKGVLIRENAWFGDRSVSK
jgi:hypothetical protein